MSDRALVKQAQSGDDAAFETLVRPWLDVAFRTAWIITRHTDDAEDATQTALIKAHAAIGQFRPDASVRPWLLQIVANESRNLVRSRQRRRSDPWPDTLTPPDLDPTGNPEHMAEAHAAQSWLLAQLEHLPEADRLVIHCRYTLDLTEAEAATVLGCARGTVKSRLHRALSRLRSQIADAPEDLLP